MKITWTKYIRHHEREAYEALGWRVDDSLRGTPHGVWSYIAVWDRDGDPIEPEKIEE